jgi:hypothetical protein
MKKGQSGNAIILVLMGIILFGALAYTLMNSAKTGQGNLTKHQQKLLALEILNTAKNVDKAVQKLLSHGCSEMDISQQRDWSGNGTITNDAADRYNPNSPVDGTCHLFRPEGGNITYADIGDVYDYHLGANRIQNVGCGTASTHCLELNFVIKYVDVNLCHALNYELNPNYSGTMFFDANGMDGFTIYDGTTFSGGSVIGNDDATLASKRTACYQDNVGNPQGYIFYHVLIER